MRREAHATGLTAAFGCHPATIQADLQTPQSCGELNSLSITTGLREGCTGEKTNDGDLHQQLRQGKTIGLFDALCSFMHWPACRAPDPPG